MSAASPKRLSDFAEAFGELAKAARFACFGRPEEIGEVVAWLLTDSVSFVTGVALSADGGYLAI